jgi:glycosyltransferase involved in cell wall biosynthesis
MAYGFEKPVVITDVGGLGEFVDEEKTGIVVPVPTAEAVATGIRRYFELRPATDFSTHIRERVASNSFSDIQDVFQEVYELFH